MSMRLSKWYLVAWPAFLLPCLSGGCKQESPSSQPSGPVQSRPAGGETAWLTDVTAQAGIHFVHDSHRTGRYRYPEIFGSGVGVLDYDNDDWYDLYFVQGGKLPGVDGGRELSDRLYRNRGNGTFEDVTERAGIHETGYGMGVVCGDYDNDGCVDVYVYNLGPDTLYRNNGDGTFTDVTATAGVGNPGWGDAAAFLDYDQDGWLDLFLVNYVVWNPVTEPLCVLERTSHRDYCGPLHFQGDYGVLYRNNRDGTFSDVSGEAGISAQAGSGMGIGVADFDGDGLLDVYIGNDARPNFMWTQRKDRTFHDTAGQTLCDLNLDGVPQSSMGITIEDFNLDGRFDLLLGHFMDDPDTLYLNRGPAFMDVSIPAGLSILSRPVTTFGISVLDLRNDGRMHVFFGNGSAHRTSKTAADDDDLAYAEKDLILQWSFETLRFTDIGKDVGPVAEARHCTRGTAVIDYDNDGDLDLVACTNNGPARLLRCDAPRSNHWLMVRAIGPDGKRDACDAVIEVEAGGRVRRRPLFVACSYCSSADPRLHFGLGPATVVNRLTVYWPGGGQDTWRDVPADQVFVARHPAASGKGPLQP